MIAQHFIVALLQHGLGLRRELPRQNGEGSGGKGRGGRL
jgi:hypothetical protein